MLQEKFHFDSHGWEFGVSVVTRRDDVVATPVRFGWDDGLGTSWYSDPREDLAAILMTPTSLDVTRSPGTSARTS